MRETNPLKFPWKNKFINKKIEETERKNLCRLIPMGQMYHIDWKTQDQGNINNLYVCEVQWGRLYLIYIFFY